MIKKKSITLKIIIILIILIPLINHFLIFIVQADTNYSIDLEKGTQILEVKKYDDEIWKNTVDITSTPSDWFGGDADKIRAKSKFTLLSYNERNKLNAYYLFSNLVIPQNFLPLFINISNYGYDFTYIKRNYPNIFEVWENWYSYWSFTAKEFNDYADTDIGQSYIFKFPQDSSRLLNDYNDFAGKINNDTNLQLLGYSLPVLSGDDLVWQFITRRFPVGNPKNEYLTTLKNTIGCKNATISGNKLIFQRYGEKNYTVEVTYSVQGLIDHIIVKNSEGYIFYEITSFYPKTIFYIILGIIAIFVLGIVVVLIIKKYKLQRYFNQNIENNRN